MKRLRVETKMQREPLSEGGPAAIPSSEGLGDLAGSLESLGHQGLPPPLFPACSAAPVSTWLLPNQSGWANQGFGEVGALHRDQKVQAPLYLQSLPLRSFCNVQGADPGAGPQIPAPRWSGSGTAAPLPESPRALLQPDPTQRALLKNS